MHFIRNSSVYALARTHLSSYYFSKILWSLAMSLCLVAVTFKMVKFCLHYQEHPVVVSLNVVRQKKLEFPAVTICNLNRMKDNHHYPPVNENSFGEPLRISERRELQFCRKFQNQRNISSTKLQPHLNFIQKWHEMSEDRRILKGHNLSTFIQQCTFKGEICLKEHFSNFSNLLYGNCITFNKRTNKREPLQISETGTGNGLLLDLYLESSAYIESTTTIGAVLVIHDPDEIPVPEEKGYIIVPGHETVIGMKQIIFKRLPAPYRDQCIDYKARSEEFTRSKDGCIRQCIQKRSFLQCGCIDPTLGKLHDFRFCGLSNETESCCLDDVLDEMSQKGSTRCYCPLPCRTVSYGEVLSKSLLRSMNFTSYLSLSKYDTARIRIFYSTLQKLVYEQHPRWEEFQLLSILGNEIALWLGTSLVILGEILELLILLVKHVLAYIV